MLPPSGCAATSHSIVAPLRDCGPQVFADGATDQSLVIEIVVRVQPASCTASRAAGTKCLCTQETLAAEGEASARLAFNDLADTNEATSRLLTSTAPLGAEAEDLCVVLSCACQRLSNVFCTGQQDFALAAYGLQGFCARGHMLIAKHRQGPEASNQVMVCTGCASS